MSEQRELPLTFPELSAEAPLIPVRMINEYTLHALFSEARVPRPH